MTKPTIGLDDPRNGSGTDDDKLTAALSYLAQQTHKPTLILPRGRDATFTQAGRQPFSGLRINGGAPDGPLNMEIGSTLPYRIHVNTAGPWWDSTGINVQSTWFGHFACQYGAGARFWRSDYGAGGTAPYPIEFEHHGHYGGTGVFGTYAEKCTFTQAVFSGHWATMGFTDTPYHLGGADMDLWVGGNHNIESQQPNSKPVIWADYLSNSYIGPIYLTSPKGWRGILVDGDVAETKGCALIINGARVEGHNGTDLPAYGTLLRVKGGQVSVRDMKIARPMTSPAGDEFGAVQIEGGDVSLDGLFYDPVNFQGPMVHVAGGTCRVTNAKSITRQQMVVHDAGGTITADSSVIVA